MKKIPEAKTCPNCGNEFLVGGRGRPKRSQRFCSHHCQMTLANPSPNGHGSSAPRPKKNKDTLHNEEWLRWRYLAEERSAPEIAIELNCSVPTVWCALKKFGVPTRSASEARAGRKIKNAMPAPVGSSVYNSRKRGQDGRQSLKKEMVAAYGGKCVCCGEKELAFLTVDHISRNGAEHRKEIGGQSYLYRLLKSQGWPTDNYRCLCMNCNFATRLGRTCPHELARQMKCGKKVITLSG